MHWRCVLKSQACLVAWLLGNSLAAGADPLAPAGRAAAPRSPAVTNYPSMVEADGRLRFKFGEERLVLPRGLQPSLLRTRSGALVVQAQVPEKPGPSTRMVYLSAIETRVSRDDGLTWQRIPLNNAVVANLSAGMSIRKAIAAANRLYPEEALKPEPEHWDDLAARYDYIREHKAILKKLGMSET